MLRADQGLSPFDPAVLAIFEAMPEPVWLAYPDGRIAFVSAKALDLLGVSKERVIENGWQALAHPDERDALFAQVARTLQTGEPFEFEGRMLAADGSYRWIRSRACALRDGEAIVAFLGHIVDVDEYIHAFSLEVRAQQRQQLLLRATAALSRLPDPEQIFQAVVDECVPDIADWAQVFTYDGAVWRSAALRGAPPDVDVPAAPLHRVLQSAAPVPFDCGVVTPLIDKDGVFAALVTSYGPTRRAYEPADVETLRLLGERVSVIVENARRFAREHRVAEVLQRASLPRALPSPRGIELYAVYAAAPSDAQIGGDWYDALELSDGRVILSIGDVTGRGLDAAVTMANMRQVLRGIAHVHPDPALMLEAADRALRSDHPDTYVTCFTCVVDPIESTLAYASAGHPPALLRKNSGEVIALGPPGLPLGLRTLDEPGVSLVHVSAGDALVFYTDGLTEVAHRPQDGEMALIALLQAGGVLSETNPARAMYERLAGNARDDVAVLVAKIGRLDAVTQTRSLRRWSGNARDEQRVRAIRAQIRDELSKATRDADLRFRTDVVLGELIGNALRHTPGSIEVILERRRGAFVLHVIDDGEGFQFVPKLPLDQFSEGGRGLYMAAHFSADFSVTRRPQGGSHARAILTPAQ